MFTCTLCLIKFENEPYAKLPHDSTLERFLASLEQASEADQEFLICKPCNRSFQLMKHLQAYLSETEMKIEAYLQYRKETDVLEEESIVLEDVLAYLQGNIPKGAANNEHICRICLQWITLPDSAYLLEEDSDLHNILKLLWPKLDLHSLVNQFICNICGDNLNDVLTFYQKCCNSRSNCGVCPIRNLRMITSTTDNKVDIFPSENDSDLCNVNLLVDSNRKGGSETRRFLSESVKSELENPSQQQSETLTEPSGDHDESVLELDISECFDFHKSELDSCATLRSRNHLRPRKKVGADKSNVSETVELLQHKRANVLNVTSESSQTEVRLSSPSEVPNCTVKSGQIDIIKCSANNTDQKIQKSKRHNKCDDAEMKIEDSEEIMKCANCAYETNSKKYLLVHLLRNHRNRTFKCFDCGFEAKIKNNLIIHIKRKHMKDDTYFCLQCNYTATVPIDLKNHVKYSHDSNTEWFECPYCSQKSKRKDQLKIHIKRIHENDEKCKIFKCTDCTFKTLYIRSYRDHLKVKHSKEIAETYHRSDSSYKKNLTKHLKVKHAKNIEMFKCADCKYETKLRIHLYTHIRHKYVRNETILKCTQCSFDTWYKHALAGHIRDNHFVFYCANCEYDTLSKKELKNHIKSTHLKKKRFNCIKCSYSTDNDDLFKRHFRRQHGKMHKCSECSYSSTRTDLLREHMLRIHDNNNKKKMKCRYCDFESEVRYNVQKHERRKHSTNIYKCSQCTYETNRKDSMLRHKRFKHK